MEERNARFKAWREVGVPVSGGWQEISAGRWRLVLECDVCGANGDIDEAGDLLQEEGCVRGAPAYLTMELAVLDEILSYDGCVHLPPLLEQPSQK